MFSFSFLALLFLTLLFSQFFWKFWACLLIIFLHLSLSATNFWKVFCSLYFPKRSNLWRSFFSPSLKLFLGLPCFRCPWRISPCRIKFGIRFSPMRATWPVYLSLANLQDVSTAVIETPLFDSFALSKFVLYAFFVIRWSRSTSEILSLHVFPAIDRRKRYCFL